MGWGSFRVLRVNATFAPRMQLNKSLAHQNGMKPEAIRPEEHAVASIVSGDAFDHVLVAFHDVPFRPTSIRGGNGMLVFRGFQRCRQPLCMSIYTDAGGWSCMTASSASQKMSFTSHICRHDGVRVDPAPKETDTCSQPAPSLAIMKMHSPRNRSRNAPLLPKFADEPSGPVRTRLPSGT